ncbi:substrate-binding periplasmic protein [Kineobactrum salinum]|uniref:Amino acid ABC transporter substrate-binding protein n=1 Tax=Kineobactrum salinum TaxID=2708301 RepID=A0A6C0U181_9GAMM|nr:transporter substrate-binding domain-containing protein [Kineobactrum salinum]QIB64085.1 amino acid ABC transporter substrate-binding protein [Kineobactrum salinum]
MLRHLLVLILCWSAASAPLADVLRVALAPDQPPLQYRDEGRIVGIEPDNARAVGEILGRRVELVAMSAAELLPALEQERVDVVMSGLSISPERSARVRFTEPYLQTGQMAIMRVDRAGRFGQPWAIFQPGVRIGVEPDSPGEAFARRELGEASVSLYPDPEAAFAALRADEIDLFVHEAATSWRLANDTDNADLISQYHPLTEEPLAWAVHRDNTALELALNRALAQMRGNGTLGYIIDRWVPVQVEAD